MIAVIDYKAGNLTSVVKYERVREDGSYRWNVSGD